MAGKISDEAMVKATGKGPDHWFPILDEMAQKESKRSELTMRFWRENQDTVSQWWAQMTVVEWERDRGRRVVNQDCAGNFQMSASKTLPINPGEAWGALLAHDWLPGLVYEEGHEFTTSEGVQVTVRAVRPSKLLRLWWHGEVGKSTLEVMFFPAKEKTSVRFQHQKLPNESDVEIFKSRWRAVLSEIAANL